MTTTRMKSDQVRLQWRSVLEQVRDGETILIEHYNRPVAVIGPAIDGVPALPGDEAAYNQRMTATQLAVNAINAFPEQWATAVSDARNSGERRSNEVIAYQSLANLAWILDELAQDSDDINVVRRVAKHIKDVPETTREADQIDMSQITALLDTTGE